MTEIITPCLFCGSADVAEHFDHRAVRCHSCKAQGPRSDSSEEAIRAWNTINYKAVEDRHRLLHMRPVEEEPKYRR